MEWELFDGNMKNVKIAGTNYNNVPSIDIPLQTSGVASFFDVSDTTATASDVADGKYFYTSSGVKTEGTNRGGASNFVTGTFITGTAGTVQTVSIPYSGTGYPVMIVVVIEGGAYVSGTTWYNSIQRYAVGQWTCTKSVFSSSPTYSTSGTQNQGVTTAIYKNSTSSSTSYTRTSGMNTNVFSSSNAANAALTCVRMKSSTSMSVFVATSSYGLLADTTYRYYIAYSG